MPVDEKYIVQKLVKDWVISVSKRLNALHICEDCIDDTKLWYFQTKVENHTPLMGLNTRILINSIIATFVGIYASLDWNNL